MKARSGRVLLLPLLLQQDGCTAVAAAASAAPVACGAYCASTGCGWTDDYACPWAIKAGQKGWAAADNSTGYACCCVDRTSAAQACGGAAAGGGGKCQQSKGLDCVGADVANAPTPGGFGQCCALCQKTAGCHAFTLDAFDGAGKANPTCYMKSGCATVRRVPRPAHTAHVRSC